VKFYSKTEYLPVRILVITLGGIFLAEIIAMVFVYLLRPLPYFLETLIDAAIMVVFIFPVIYYFSYRPLLLNITHRQKVEKALWESNEIFEKIFSLTHVLFVYMDPDFNIIRVNRAYAAADEREPEFYIGKNHFDLFPNAENEAIFRQVAQTGKPFLIFAKPFEYAEHPERGVSYWDWTLLPTKTETGEVNGLLLSLIDVTAREKTELALIESEQRFQGIFDHTFQFIAMIAPDGEVVEINQTALVFTGQERSSIVGLPFWEAFAQNFDDQTRLRLPELIQRAAQGEFVRYESEITNSQSEVIFVDHSLKPFKNKSGDVNLIIAEGHDITARKKMEKALEQEQQRLYALLDQLPAIVTLQSKDYQILFANSRFRQLFGDPKFKRCYQILMGYSEPCPECLISEVAATKLLHTWKKTYLNGRSYQIYGYPFSDPEHTSAVLELGVDITETEQAQATIQQNAARAMVLTEILEFILEVSPNYQAILEKITHSIVRLIGDACVIRLISEDLATHKVVSFHHADQQIYARLLQTIDTDKQPVESGLTGQVIRTRQPLSAPAMELGQVKVANPKEFPSYLADHPFHYLLCIPLQAKEALIGTITIFRDQNDQPYMEDDFQFVQNLADQAALAIQNARLFESELKARRTAEILQKASLALTQTLDLSRVMELFLDYANQLAPYEWASMFLIEDETHLLLRARRGSGALEIGTILPIDPESMPVIHNLMANKKSILISDSELDPRTLDSIQNCKLARSWLGIPLIVEGKSIGVCIFENTNANAFSNQNIQLLEALIGQVTLVIQNAWFFEQMRFGRERLQSLSRRLVEVQESERRYVARELHDEASQALTSLIVGLRLIEREAQGLDSVLAGTAELKLVAEGVIGNLHRLAMDLRPASLDVLGLVAALRQYVEIISDRHNLVLQFEVIKFEDRLPLDIETAIYRIVQEALSNVILHAQATRADVLLEKRNEQIIVIVEDNGIGFDPLATAKSGRLGLVGMRERADMLGGKLMVESQPGIGTTLFLEVPYGP
jgi:PAS domain S-box-containing protein